ncbi:MAG: sulfatase [Acidobacteria bacterium]|nr:sulfatase [Acidobacteriota bacterium]
MTSFLRCKCHPASLGLSILLVAAAACGPGERPPSVVIVVIDSLRADHLHHAGDPRDLSPRLDALAAQATRFSQAGASAPWTTPSVMTLFTGLTPGSHHVDLNDRALDAAVPTLAERFQEAGYRTAAVMPALTLADHFGFDRGFDDFIFATQGHGNVSGPWSISHAIEFLRGHRDEPVFLYVHLWDVHYNYNPPVPHSIRFQAGRPAGPGESDDITALTGPGHHAASLSPERVAWLEGQYAGEILFTDEQVGRLLDELDRLGRTDDTVVVVTSDHGEAFLEHRVMGHTVHLYDEMTHVPLMVRWPGQVAAGRVVAEQVGLVDMMPTLLDLVGIPFAPHLFEGRSLAPLLRSARPEEEGPPVLLGTSRQAMKRGLRTPAWSYQVDLVTGEDELYDLAADPAQRENLADSLTGEASVWRRRLCDRLAQRLPGGEVGIDPLPADLQESLAAGLRTLGYVSPAGSQGGRQSDPVAERRTILQAAGCPVGLASRP